VKTDRRTDGRTEAIALPLVVGADAYVNVQTELGEVSCSGEIDTATVLRLEQHTVAALNGRNVIVGRECVHAAVARVVCRHAGGSSADGGR